MITRLAHVCLSATDLSAVLEFYCAGLGFRKRFDFVRGGRVVGFYLEASPGSYIEVFLQEAVDLKARCPIQHLCLEVEDIDQVGRNLRAHGYEATAKELGADHTWQLWTTDPTGVRLELQQYTERSCQVTGENCVLEP